MFVRPSANAVFEQAFKNIDDALWKEAGCTGVWKIDYLTELQRHASELAAAPAEWMPWTYRETIERGGV